MGRSWPGAATPSANFIAREPSLRGHVLAVRFRASGRNSFTWARDENDAKARPEDIAKVDQQLGYSLAAAYGYDGDRNRWALMMNTTLSDAFFTKREAVATQLQNIGLSPNAD